MEVSMFRLLLTLFLLFSISVKAETLTIVIQSSTGQPYHNARLIGKYFLKHNPNFEDVNIKVVPGAGGMTAANYMFNIANPENYIIGTFTKSVILRSVLNDKNSNLDLLKFNWIGSSSDGREDPTVLISRKKIEDEIIIGDFNSSDLNTVDLVKSITNLKLKKIGGYKDVSEIRYAYLRKEIDGLFNVYSGMLLNDSSWKSNIIMQYGNGLNKHKDLQNVPTLMEITSDENAVGFLELLNVLAKPFVASPKISAEKLIELRNTFENIMNDPDFKEECKKLYIDTTFVDHNKSIEIINRLYGTKDSLPKFHLAKD